MAEGDDRKYSATKKGPNLSKKKNAKSLKREGGNPDRGQPTLDKVRWKGGSSYQWRGQDG